MDSLNYTDIFILREPVDDPEVISNKWSMYNVNTNKIYFMTSRYHEDKSLYQVTFILGKTEEIDNWYCKPVDGLKSISINLILEPAQREFVSSLLTHYYKYAADKDYNTELVLDTTKFELELICRKMDREERVILGMATMSVDLPPISFNKSVKVDIKDLQES